MNVFCLVSEIIASEVTNLSINYYIDATLLLLCGIGIFTGGLAFLKHSPFMSKHLRALGGFVSGMGVFYIFIAVLCLALKFPEETCINPHTTNFVSEIRRKYFISTWFGLILGLVMSRISYHNQSFGLVIVGISFGMISGIVLGLITNSFVFMLLSGSLIATAVTYYEIKNIRLSSTILSKIAGAILVGLGVRLAFHGIFLFTYGSSFSWMLFSFSNFAAPVAMIVLPMWFYYYP